jgi:flagellin FlaB
MFERKLKPDDRGQVGIGTLIVFIAMVLVAAIAAGVLVNTADMLQESAEQTGEESQAQVSDRLRVVDAYAESDKLYVYDTAPSGSSAIGKKAYTTDSTSGSFGDINGDDTEGETGVDDQAAVHELGFLVMRASGANDINLETVTVSWQGPDGAEQTTIVDSEHFDTSSVAGDSNTLLDSSSDRILVTLTLGEIYVSDGSGGSQLESSGPGVTNFGYLTEGDEVTIKFNTESGATVTKRIKIPSLIQDGETISV